MAIVIIRPATPVVGAPTNAEPTLTLLYCDINMDFGLPAMVSASRSSVERMFESRSARPLPPETISRLEEVLERWRLREPTAESAAWMEQIATAVRIENRAVAAQLVAIGQLFAYRYEFRDRRLGGRHGSGRVR